MTDNLAAKWTSRGVSLIVHSACACTVHVLVRTVGRGPRQKNGKILTELSFFAVFNHNKLETFEDALWKLQNFNTQNWKPCTLDLSPCGKRNAVKSRLGHLWIVFYKWYPPLFALSHPFKPLVDYRLLCSQYNTGRTSYSGTSLPKRPAFGPQNSQPFAGFVNNSQRVDPRVSCFIDNVII